MNMMMIDDNEDDRC